MSAVHLKEPRNVGFSQENSEYYDLWTASDSDTIFTNKLKADLFVFATALGKNRDARSKLKSKKPNVNVRPMTPKQKWALLSIAISESGDISLLEDEAPLYALAEEYANEGIKILKHRMEDVEIDHPGTLYFKELELELKKILQKD